MKKILVVFTGGTIGSKYDRGTINTLADNNYKLLNLFEENYSNGEIFDCIQPLNLLSENLFPSVWRKIITSILAEPVEQYTGIIITHGTDTLPYSAAAISFCLNNLACPILLVSSNYPLEDKRANGLVNFNCAVQFINQHNIPGVYVPYQNPGQPMLIHLGTRIVSSLQLSGDFISVQFKPFMTFEKDNFTQLHPVSSRQIEFGNLNPKFSQNILLIRPYPGLDYSKLNISGTDAVLHDLYHSGTACATRNWGKDHSLTHFIDLCTKRQVPIYLAPAMKSKSVYQSTEELLNLGAEMIWNMTLETSYVKLCLAFGNFQDTNERNLFLSTNIAHELVPS